MKLLNVDDESLMKRTQIASVGGTKFKYFSE